MDSPPAVDSAKTARKSRRPSRRPRPAYAVSPPRIALVAITLLAVALGGSTELWEQALVAMLAAGLMLVAPPARSLGPAAHIILGALMALALSAFLPATLFDLPWRSHLVQDLHLTLPTSRTPEPWLTAQACCLLFVGGVWAYYVLAQEWTSEQRLPLVRLLIFGLSVLAAIAVAAFSLGFHVPTWDQEENRGWFPNRNQTADVLALSGVITYALIFDCLRRNRRSLLLWLGALVVLDAALIISYSRAGILLFFGGIALWHIWPSGQPRRRQSSAKWMALGLTIIFVLLSFFFMFGGTTLSRFEGPLRSIGENHFRWAIQADAVRFSLQSPILGVGLGNFEPLFATARQASVNADRAIHPESDWLWLAGEMGWLAPLLMIAAVVWWMRRCLPFEPKSGESLRRALFVAGILFVAHGFVDVSGHRIGSLFVALVIFSLAMRSHEGAPSPASRLLFFRPLAIGVLLVAAWWGASSFGFSPLPTTADLDRAEAKIDQALAQGQVAVMEQQADQALALAPLNWHLYFQRAYAETFQPGKLKLAGADFMTARQLEGKWVGPCFDEGLTWLAAGQPDLCLDAWEEALRRSPANEEASWYNEMLSHSRGNDQVKAGLLDLARGQLDRELIFLDYASADEAHETIIAILRQDPGLRALDHKQLKTLFQAWWDQGDRLSLIQGLKAHPDWMKAGWLFAAQACAAKSDFLGAWKAAATFASPPLMPAIATDRSLEDLQTAFSEERDNLSSGVLLYFAQMKAGKFDDAITTARLLEKEPQCPRYIFYLEAKGWAAKAQWQLAWEAWLEYHAA